MSKLSSNEIKHNLLEISDDLEVIESYICDYESYGEVEFDDDNLEALYEDFNEYRDNL